MAIRRRSERKEREQLIQTLKEHPEFFGYHETSGHVRTLDESFEHLSTDQLRKMVEHHGADKSMEAT